MNARVFYLYRKQNRMRKFIFLFLLVPGFFQFTACTTLPAYLQWILSGSLVNAFTPDKSHQL